MIPIENEYHCVPCTALQSTTATQRGRKPTMMTFFFHFQRIISVFLGAHSWTFKRLALFAHILELFF